MTPSPMMNQSSAAGGKPPAAASIGTPATDPKTEQSGPGFSLARSIRLQVVIAVIVLLGGLLVLRLLDMQLRTWSEYDPNANSIDARYTVDDSTPWGVIVDRDGVLLAGDRFTYRVTATPKHIERENWAALSEQLARLAGIPAEQVWNRLAANPDAAYVVLASNVSFPMGRALIDAKQEEIDNADSSQDLSLLPLGNVFVHAQPRRFYPQASLASQVLGFLNAERKPVLGLERYYTSFLPSNGVGLPRGNISPRTVLSPQQRKFLPSGSEKGLVLTIDRTIQWIIEEELADGVQFYGAESGSVIVMEPTTGAILGMANYPTFDANQYEDADPASFTNSTVSAQYEPGSIFKVITVAGAVDAGAVESTTIFTDTGTIVIGQRTIQNSGRNAMGQLMVADALAQWATTWGGGSIVPTGTATALIGGPILLMALRGLRNDRHMPGQESGPAKFTPNRKPLILPLILLGLALVAVVILAMSWSPSLSGWQWTGMANWDQAWDWRGPRILAALTAGVVLGIAGTLIQRLTGNVMASPEVLGISGGAALSMVILTLLGLNPDRSWQLLAGAAGGASVLGLLFVLSRRHRFSGHQLLLGGVAIYVFMDAGIRMVLAGGGTEAMKLLTWLSGSTWLVTETEALALRDAAREAGFGIMVGCMMGSSLGMAPAQIVAQGAEVVDLDPPLLLAEDRDVPLRYDEAGVHPPERELWG